MSRRTPARSTLLSPGTTGPASRGELVLHRGAAITSRGGRVRIPRSSHGAAPLFTPVRQDTFTLGALRFALRGTASADSSAVLSTQRPTTFVENHRALLKGSGWKGCDARYVSRETG